MFLDKADGVLEVSRYRLAYTEKLQALHQLYQETFKQAKQRSFVTQHAAFNYLALEYGLNQVSIGVSVQRFSPQRVLH